MVTVRNDIEMMAPAPDGTKVKDVNLKQEAQPDRRRSYRCVTTVGVVTVVLLSLAVGGVFLCEYVLNGMPTENNGDGSPSSTVGPEGAAVHHQSVPTFADPFDGKPGQPSEEIALDPVDDDEIDIDGTPATSLTTTTAGTTTTTEMESIDEASGDGRDDDDGKEDVHDYSSGSGSGDDDLW